MQHKKLLLKNRLQKAFFYAKVTAAVAAGAWLSLQPLASPAQVKSAPQQKTTSAPAAQQPSAAKGKAISFSDAQASKKQPSYDTVNEILTLRLKEENADSANLQLRILQARAYASWVYDTLKYSLKIKPHECERFIIEADNVLHYSGAKKIRFESTETDLLSSAMQSRSWDCDNTASLLFDVGRRLGLPVAVVFASTGSGGHVVLKVGKFFMEPDGEYYGEAELNRRYGVYLVTIDPAKIASTGYENLGSAAREAAKLARNPAERLALYLHAVELYSKAIMMAPEVGIFYRLRAHCLSEMKQYDSAASDMNKAVEIEPSNKHARLQLADIYFELGKYKEALFEYNIALNLEPGNADAQEGVKKCFGALRNFQNY